MTERHIATISALWDGDAVDPDALAAALNDAAARTALVDFARLRREVRDAADPLPDSLSTPRRDGAQWFDRRVPLGAVAALLLLMFMTGWLLPRPPAAEPGGGPPQPTRTISFEPGVDWQSTP